MKNVDLINKDLADGQTHELDGKVNFYKLSGGITLVELDMRPEENVMLKLNDNKNMYFHFMYNLKGSISLKSIRKLKPKQLSRFQSAITHDKKGFDTFIELKAGRDYRLCIIQLSKYTVGHRDNPLFSQFEDVFHALNDDLYFIHTGLPNLQLGEYVRKLMDMPKTRLSDNLMASGYVNIILSIKFKQFLDYIKQPVSESSVLGQVEIERIRNISTEIQSSPEREYRIVDICKEAGLNAAKLQSGFKEMHGKTVCNYISHVRLQKAEELLKTTDLNVSQIVYSLGWSSRSYFCKIFKEKYKCSPKSYQNLLLTTQ